MGNKHTKFEDLVKSSLPILVESVPPPLNREYLIPVGGPDSAPCPVITIYRNEYTNRNIIPKYEQLINDYNTGIASNWDQIGPIEQELIKKIIKNLNLIRNSIVT